ncbi:MAG: RlmE family RNA methyltransferase [archaeon]|nr:RlmE family RNA methyltransferase [archaeon]MCP8320681.1 RlmE family RNA methyltransferase [archaeon]
MKLDRAKKDQYRRIAKREGYRSRASFKLMQIDRKYKIFKNGHVVVDFGCAPGGWLQYISKVIENKGFALGIDLKKVEPIGSNVDTLVADVKDEGIKDKIKSKLPKRADVVTSDLSPSLSGIWELDVAKQIDLTSRVFEILPFILKEGGYAIMKVFQGEPFDEFLKKIKKNFKDVIIVKPPASRPESSEMYLVCRGFFQQSED